MGLILLSCLGFIVTVSILVTIHEWGHFWVARKCNVHVLRFSFGFGKPLWKIKDQKGTEYVISMIPLGGYVSLYGEQEEPSPQMKHLAFKAKALWQRILIVLAGPFVNFMFAILALTIVYVSGVWESAPKIGQVITGSLAEKAGFKPYDTIERVNNRTTPNWEAVTLGLVNALGQSHPVSISVKNNEKQSRVYQLSLADFQHQAIDGQLLQQIGWVLLDPFPAVIQKVMPESSAVNAKLQAGDVIWAVNHVKTPYRQDVTHWVQENPQKTLLLSVKRGNKNIEITITPKAKTVKAKTIGVIGIVYDSNLALAKNDLNKIHYSAYKSFRLAIHKTYDFSLLTLNMLKKIVTFQISTRHLSGPLEIGRHAGISMSYGPQSFLNFLAMVSISIGVFNLLPIPMLDGSYMIYAIYEVLTRKKVSKKFMQYALTFGASILLFLSIIAITNDLSRYFEFPYHWFKSK